MMQRAVKMMQTMAVRRGVTVVVDGSAVMVVVRKVVTLMFM